MSEGPRVYIEAYWSSGLQQCFKEQYSGEFCLHIGYDNSVEGELNYHVTINRDRPGLQGKYGRKLPSCLDTFTKLLEREGSISRARVNVKI